MIVYILFGAVVLGLAALVSSIFIAEIRYQRRRKKQNLDGYTVKMWEKPVRPPAIDVVVSTADLPQRKPHVDPYPTLRTKVQDGYNVVPETTCIESIPEITNCTFELSRDDSTDRVDQAESHHHDYHEAPQAEVSSPAEFFDSSPDYGHSDSSSYDSGGHDGGFDAGDCGGGDCGGSD